MGRFRALEHNDQFLGLEFAGRAVGLPGKASTYLSTVNVLALTAILYQDKHWCSSRDSMQRDRNCKRLVEECVTLLSHHAMAQNSQPNLVEGELPNSYEIKPAFVDDSSTTGKAGTRI